MAHPLSPLLVLTKRIWDKIKGAWTKLGNRTTRLVRSGTLWVHTTTQRLVTGVRGALRPLASPVHQMPQLVRNLALAIVLLVPAALAVSAGQAWYSVHLAREEKRNALPAVEVPLAEAPTPLPEVVPIPELKPVPKPVVKKPVVVKPRVIAKPCINDSKLKPNQRCVPKLEKYMPNSFKRKNGQFVCSKKNDHPRMSKKYSGTHVDMQCCLDPDEIPNPWCTYK